MPDQNDPRPPRVEAAHVGGTQVPDLIERYRVRRDAWIAQADELARLRDEVRGAAEREAMEIVTAARRDVRQVIMEARRELLVLSAQVQAALGEVPGKPDPAALLKAHAASSAVAAVGLPPSPNADHSSDVLVPEAAVKTMLDEARADIEALAHDAKTVPFHSASLASHSPLEHQPSILSRATAFESPPAQTIERAQPSTFFGSPHPNAFEAVAAPPIDAHEVGTVSPEDKATIGGRFESSVQFESMSTLLPPSAGASRVLVSLPFPTDSVPVPSGRSMRAFVALFVAIGVVVLGGSVWWVRAHGNASSSEDTSGARSTESPSTAAATKSTSPSASSSTSAPVVPAKQTSSLPLSLVVEARRQSWIRTTVDGESDSGRTYAAGETVRLNARHGISLRVGDAGAVYVSVNKGAAVPVGPSGQVMTRQFVAEAGAKTAVAPAPSVPVPAAPKPVAPPASVPTASAAPAAPVPVPLVQQRPPQNVAAANPNPLPAVIRRDAPTAALPRTESATTPTPPVVPPIGASAAPATVPPPGPVPNVSPASAVVAAARQWLDAYHRQERSTMAALSTENLQLADERRPDERFPAGADVNRSLDRVSVQIAADTAVLTAVMTERGDTGAQRVSPISQVWILSGGQWRVKQVRLVSEARLNQIFR